MLESLVYKST